jgi:hypothetical protein
VYVTVGEKFPTVDIRHFWIPIDSDKPVPSKRGIALNQYKRNGLQNGQSELLKIGDRRTNETV